MASEIDICNLALGHLGEDPTISSIDPPEGSAHAEKCAMFYPIARDTLLDSHSWSFITKRRTLAMLTPEWPEWDYAYAAPSDSTNIIAILPADATDDYSLGTEGDLSNLSAGYVPRAYVLEVSSSGAQVILTDEPNAVCRYNGLATDPALFPPLLVTTLSWMLASFLAGPVLKGDVGAAEAKRCLAMADRFLGRSTASDANQRNVKPAHAVPWIAGR